METPTFTVTVFYRDRRTAVDWLTRAFGFELTMAIDGGPDDDALTGHYEMAIGGQGRIVISGEWAGWCRSPAELGGANTQSTHVALARGLDEHCARARAEGATILAEPADQFYGDRTYRAVDPEGHVWTFAQHVRDVTRTEAEAAIGRPIEASGWA